MISHPSRWRWPQPFLFIVLVVFTIISTFPKPALTQSDCDTCITFNQLNKADPPWTARAGATLLLHPRNLTYHNASNPSQLLTAPPNSLIIFGGDSYPLTPISNDVWLSSDGGYEWQLVAGNGSRGVDAGPSFVPVTYSVVAMGGVVYDEDNSTALLVMKIGGEPEDRHEESFVYMTMDAVHWYDRIAQNLPRYQLFAAVVNSTGNILLIGGRTIPQGSAQPRPVAEVWHSDDRGQTWDYLTMSAAFGPRFSHAAVRLTGSQATGTLGADVVVIVGGTNGPTHFNDVWASSDAVTWKCLTESAAFSPRRDFSLLATDDGVLLLTAGQDTSTSFNDIFTSFDGGYSWHEYQWPYSAASVSSSITSARFHSRTRASSRATAAAYSLDQFSARHSHAAVLDASGYLVISGGLSTSSQRVGQQHYLTDIIRSSISFSNSSLLAAVFGATISSCGIGLFCFDDSTSFGAGGVTCTSCSEDHVSLVILCVVIAVIVCFFVAFILWRNFGVKAEHEKPVGFNEHLVNEDEVDE